MKCNHCDKKSFFKCENCKSVYYCSQICQQKEWLYIHNTECELYRFLQQISLNQGDVIQDPSEIQNDDSGYTVDRKIGEGGFGSAWLVKDRNDNYFIVKIVKQIFTSDRQIIINELYIHRILQKRNGEICELHASCAVKSFIDKKETFIIFPSNKNPAIDLSTYIKDTLKDRKMLIKEEDTVKNIEFKIDIINIAIKMTNNLLSLHKKRIYHRDIKPNNMVATINSKSGNLENTIIIDFGFSVSMVPDIDILKSENDTQIKGILQLLTETEKKEIEQGKLPNFLTKLTSRGTSLYKDPRFFIIPSKPVTNEKYKSNIDTEKMLRELDIFALGFSFFDLENTLSPSYNRRLSELQNQIKKIYYGKYLAIADVPKQQNAANQLSALRLIPWKDKKLVLNNIIQKMTKEISVNKDRPTLDVILQELENLKDKQINLLKEKMKTQKREGKAPMGRLTEKKPDRKKTIKKS